jgi:thiaminase (transcriptional activator TenA)
MKMLRSEELWFANEDLTQACLDSAFIQHLSSGSLPREQFIQYLRQESFCQEACARAYGVAAAKAPDWEGFSALHQLMSESVSSLRVRHQIAAKWGDSPMPLTPHPVIQRYTDFLISTAWNEDLGMILATIVPRFRLLHFLGQSLISLGLPRHAYADWVLSAGSQKSGQIVALLESLLNQYMSIDNQQFSSYRYALLCERDFLGIMGQQLTTIDLMTDRSLLVNRPSTFS